MGLVETGVGLIPAGGGTKEMMIRANEHAASAEDLDLFHALKPVFENIAMGKVSTSAEEARTVGYLRSGDLISMNRDRLVADAKAEALAIVRAGYHHAGTRGDSRTGRGISGRRETGDSFDATRRIHHGI